MSTAFKGADILLPKDADMQKWAVVACDQYTSEPEYWDRVEKYVGDEKSAYNLILPEVYLEQPGVDYRIDRIHRTMKEYLEKGAFTEYKNAMVYVERTQSDGRVRQGLIGAIDLQEYEYYKGSESQVRATEATVIERIPPRIKIRKGAPIELPHIMILIDDVKKRIIEPLADKKDEFTKLYDFDLMEGGGHITGWLPDRDSMEQAEALLERFSGQEAFDRRYGISGRKPLTYAMGDGNHSLATAKEFYETLKRADPSADLSGHPARYALVELVNLHSPALEFEAIHRIVTEVDEQALVDALTEELQLSEEESAQSFVIVNNGEEKRVYIHRESSKLTVGSLQNFLDKYTGKNGGKTDYIHGAEVVRELSKKAGSIGFLLPDMGKEELFPTVIEDGALPRKTFSMGHAADKRFYIEARKISE
ncbi:DUF1015 domain-containing protein [Ruminococcus sp.]|uniref:DUF1015 domain-containing protein n=1 Tax=Ruminococcus sp. TaxID=41978 RepID=UPI0025F436CB|nr:DUF1015 domain-containing protein [Ruminococcus sp.]MBQ8968061.1 DUF1015 domain-containing protein [Ruminococcus sp.]